MKHERGDCSRCAAKLSEACNEIVAFFYWVKNNHPEAHVSWTFRDQALQEECYRMGKSKLHWPDSKHNYTDKEGHPKAEAIDLFVLTNDEKAVWPRPWFEGLWNEVDRKNLPMIWGGHFRKLGDYDHFQLAGYSEEVS